jgi:hypothetical protein
LIKCDKYHQDIEDVQKTIKEVLKAPSTAVFYDMDWADSLPDDYVR